MTSPRPCPTILWAAVALTGCATTTPETVPAAGASAQEHAWRVTPPSPGPAPELRAPEIQRQLLANGLTVLTSQRGTLPLVNVQMVVRSGSAVDPAALPGVAGFLADLLKAGTKTRSAEQIADEIETLGSSLHVSVEEDALVIACTTLTENLGPIFEVMADVLMNPALEPKEIDRIRRKRLADLAQEADDPRRTANRVFRRAVFGDHPYGHPTLGSREAVAAIDRAALEAYYTSHFGPENVAVALVGAVAPAAAIEIVESNLGNWRGQAARQAALPELVEGPAVVRLIDKPNAPQSQLRVGHLGLRRDHPDYFPVVLLNAILGGTFNSRINMNLREDKGYTYGARSAFAFLRDGGYFGVLTAVRTDATAAALREILAEIELIRGAGVSAAELDGAKNRYSLSLPGYFQTVEGVGGMVSNIYLFDLPLDYYQRLPAQLRAVSREDLLRVAKKHLRPDALSITVVGDQTQIREGLDQLGRGDVVRVGPDGEPR